MTFIRNAEAGVAERGLFEGRGPLAILLLVLLGGLALNLTPCVLPMIPINLAIIGAGAQAGSRKRGFLLGLTYGGAMAFVYGVLGLIVVLTASTFGTINASPWFNLGIALLFAALALAMFDVFEIDFSRFAGTVGAGASRGSFTLAFTMGGVAALLAGACVAPVVIQVVLFASNLYATGTGVALALPFFLGIGMAIPWPIAGAGLSSLPKPGPWMVRVKQAFGVVILATAGYYGYLAYGLFADRWVDAAEVSSSVEAKLKEGWHASLAEGLAAAEREGKPVLDRPVGHLVQELPDHGQDHPGQPRGDPGARRLREDQGAGRAARRAAHGRGDEAVRRGGFAGLRHPETAEPGREMSRDRVPDESRHPVMIDGLLPMRTRQLCLSALVLAVSSGAALSGRQAGRGPPGGVARRDGRRPGVARGGAADRHPDLRRLPQQPRPRPAGSRSRASPSPPPASTSRRPRR